MSDFLKPFTFHGMNLKLVDENARGDCPFCGKADHFFVKIKTGQYSCRRCQNEGNVYVFLDELWKASYAVRAKHQRQIDALSENRNIPVSELYAWGLCVSIIDGSFLLPQFNSKKKLANLCRIFREADKYQIRGSPGCKLHPFGTDQLLKQQTILWVAEGPWDGMALSAALKTVRFNDERWINHTGDEIAWKTQGVIAVPGAGTFDASWLQYFLNREARICFDNDHPRDTPSGKPSQPGWDGVARLLRIAGEEPHSASKFQVLVWGKGGYDAEVADGYDLRDLLRDMTAVEAMEYLCYKLITMKVSSPEKSAADGEPALEPIECNTFEELCKHFSEYLHFTDAMRATLAVCLATVASTSIDGEQLFFRLIGPPGSGKTTIAEALSACREHCFPKSILTGFHSGFTGGRGGPKTEASLIPEMNGKCVIMKDADTLLQSNARDRILAELRDIYDGSTRGHWRNKKKADFEYLRTTFLLCGTDALRALNRSFLGERFLDIDILGDSSTTEYLDAAMASAFQAVQHSLKPRMEGDSNELHGPHSTFLKQVTYGFIMTICHQIGERTVAIPTASVKTQTQLGAMAQLLSYARARVERDGDEIAYRPRVELATRLVKQFIKLAVCLAIVLGKSTVDDEVMQIVAKVMHDTAHGFGFEILQYLYDHREGKSSLSLSTNLDISESTIRRNTKDMLELKIITRNEETNHSGVGGRKTHLWILTDGIRDLMKLSNLNSFISFQRE